jgi:hypothetical protein
VRFDDTNPSKVRGGRCLVCAASCGHVCGRLDSRVCSARMGCVCCWVYC